MNTSINSDFRNDMHSWEEIDSQLKSIAKAGFSHVQWIHDWDGEFFYTLPEMLQVKAALRHYGLTAHSLHADHGGQRGSYIAGVWNPAPGLQCTKARKEFTNRNTMVRLAGVELLKNRVELCSHIGASTMVLHLQLPYEYFYQNPQNKEDFYQAVYSSLDALQPLALAAGVKIAIENLFNTPLDLEDEKFQRLFNRYDKDYIGMCYDSGHASLSFVDNFYFLLEKYNERLFATHLQDTNSIDPALLLKDFKAVSQHDLHQIPFSGVINFDKIAELVARSPIELPADFEVCCPPLSPEQEQEWLLDCKCASVKFHEMVEMYRNK